MEPFKDDRKFENAFQLAFEDAEIAPSIHIWDKVEIELSRDQNGIFKKRLFAFQLVAAASLLFAASLGFFQIMNRNNEGPANQDLQTSEQIPNKDPKQPQGNKDITPKVTDESFEDKLEKDNSELLADAIADGNQVDITKVEKAGIPIDNDAKNDAILVDANNLDQMDRMAQPIGDQSDLMFENSLVEPQMILISLQGPGIQTSNNVMELQFVPVWVKKKDDSPKSMQWASAGLSAGNYSPSSGGLNIGLAQADEAAVGTPDLSQNDRVYSDQQSGSAYSVGVGFGGRVARKWIMESGLNYVRSEIVGTTNSVVEDNNKQYPLFHEGTLDGAVLNVGVYDVKNSLQFITVPVKAGYILIDRKVGWVATGGFGSNILVANSLESGSGDFEKVNFSGEDSPYRPVSLSGIIGTEVYFNLTENYQLMIVPQYNFGITELTKAESSFTIVPNSFNLGVTFRYLLK